jgi:hypothetical protein
VSQRFIKLTEAAIERPRTKLSKQNNKKSAIAARTLLNSHLVAERRMAVLPDDLWQSWKKLHAMLFSHGAKGLTLTDAEGNIERKVVEYETRDIIFVSPHPVAFNRKESTKEITTPLFNASQNGLRFFFSMVFSGKIFPYTFLQECREQADHKPMPFKAFWDLCARLLNQYKAFITIQYWAKLLCVLFEADEEEMERKVFKFKLNDLQTWLSTSVPDNTRLALKSVEGVTPACGTKIYISRGVRNEWRPNKWQHEAMKRCLKANQVLIKDRVNYTEKGLLPNRVDPMWDMDVQLMPAWHPPNPWTGAKTEDEKLAAENAWPEGAITKSPEVTLDWTDAIKSENIRSLLSGWRTDIEKLSKTSNQDSAALELRARSTLGCKTESFSILTQSHFPPALPSNAALTGKQSPLYLASDHPEWAAFAAKWVLHIPTVLASVETPPSFPDVPYPTETLLVQRYRESGDRLLKALDKLCTDEAVPDDILPDKV